MCVVVALTLGAGTQAFATEATKDVKKEVAAEQKLTIVSPEDSKVMSDMDIAVSISYTEGDRVILFVKKQGETRAVFYVEDADLKDIGVSAYEVKLKSAGKYMVQAELYRGNTLLDVRNLEFSVTDVVQAKEYVNHATEKKNLLNPSLLPGQETKPEVKNSIKLEEPDKKSKSKTSMGTSVSTAAIY